MSFGGGGSSSTTNQFPIEFSPEEIELRDQILERVSIGVENLRRFTDFTERAGQVAIEAFESFGPAFGSGELLDFSDLEADIEAGLDPETTIRRIRDATDASIFAGQADIEEFTRRGLEQLRDVEAPTRGLRFADSPIRDRAAVQVLETAGRENANLVRSARAAEAAQVAQAQSQLPVQSAQLRAGVRSQAAQNRLNVAQLAAQAQGQLAQETSGVQQLEAFKPKLASRSTSRSRNFSIGFG